MEHSGETDGRRMRAIFVASAAVAFAVAPLVSGEFGGFDPDRYPNPQVNPPVQPAGYAFSIWGPIYVWLLISAGFGLFARSDAGDWDAPRWPILISLVVGATWLAVARVSPVWATVLILVMLAGALVALFRAPARDPWLARGPIGLYAGWLTAASLVSIALLGAGYGVLAGAIGWAWAAVLAAIAIGTAIQRALPGVPTYGIAVAWALVAVAVRNGTENLTLAILAGLGAAAMLGAAWTAYRAGD